MHQTLSHYLHEMGLAVHHLGQKWWWWWSIPTPRRSVSSSKLCNASLPSRLLHVLFLVDGLFLHEVEGNGGMTSSTSTTMATAATMAHGHKRRGATVQVLRMMA
jgi:hypothetical protein